MNIINDITLNINDYSKFDIYYKLNSIKYT